MRSREFLMKDAYSFHLTPESLAETYHVMYAAYSRIFTRLGLNFRAVQADSGSIGGDLSHEFQVLADSGEDLIAFSDKSDYAANIEKATTLPPITTRTASHAPLEKFATPGLHSIADLTEHLKIASNKTLKTLLVAGKEHKMIALVLRGDHTLNVVKAEKIPAVAAPLQFVSEDLIKKTLGCGPGSIGPVGLTIPVIIDQEAAVISDFICGANEDGFHFKNVNWERDLPIDTITDLRTVEAGDPSPDGEGKLQLTRGIEVGHIFQLGTKYSQPLRAAVLDENGDSIDLMMGCYGIGVSRIVAAAIEQNHDERGIVWPAPMAPFQIALVPLNYHKPEIKTAADKLYAELQAAGISVLMDDRDERPGVKFADMELIGIPHRVVVSERGLTAGTVEYKSRREAELFNLELATVIETLKHRVHG